MERAFYKAFYVYHGDVASLTDALRTSIVFPDFKNLYHAFALLTDIIGPSRILRVKNRFSSKNVPFGYRDLMLNIKCPACPKLVCEIQLHHTFFYSRKHAAHGIYKL